jgi:hypothetical protein
MPVEGIFIPVPFQLAKRIITERARVEPILIDGLFVWKNNFGLIKLQANYPVDLLHFAEILTEQLQLSEWEFDSIMGENNIVM